MLKRMMFWALAALVVTSVVSAQQEPIRADHPERYTVQPGDTLWDISARFLTKPWYWPEIWHENPEIDNPHLIYPGDVISLAVVDGEPRLTIDRGAGTVKLSPEVRSEVLDNAIPSIPLEAIRPFLSGDRVVEPDALRDAPYIVAGSDERVLSARGDRVYARGLSRHGHRDWDVVRQEEAFVDPSTQEPIGILARRVGSARVIERGDPATMQLTESSREILAGDRMLAASDETLDSQFVPRAPDDEISGVILAVLDGVNQIGQYDVIALNRGRREGLEMGHVLAVTEHPRTVTDPHTEERVTLPGEREGVLLVFRAFERMSLGLVMEANRAMAVGDRVSTP